MLSACRYSEIVATRPIAANEEVLIDYLHPKGQSHARRKVAFEEQHVWELAEAPPCGGGGASAPESDALAPGQPRPGEASFEAAMARVGELENELERCAQRLEEVRASLEASCLNPVLTWVWQCVGVGKVRDKRLRRAGREAARCGGEREQAVRASGGAAGRGTHCVVPRPPAAD